MKILSNSKTIDEAVNVINHMRKWKPFEWSGRHFIIQKGGEFCSYRSKASAVKNCSNEFPNLWEVS